MAIGNTPDRPWDEINKNKKPKVPNTGDRPVDSDDDVQIDLDTGVFNPPKEPGSDNRILSV